METVLERIITPAGSTTWRDEAMDASLRAEALDGRGLDALLREIRRHRPEGATYTLWSGPDRQELARFLELRAGGFRTPLAGSAHFLERDAPCPYLGWYTATWDGAAVEIALAPTGDSTGGAICIADDEATARGLALALEDFAIRPAGRCLRFTYGWRSAPDLDAEIGSVTWDDLVLRPDLLAGVREAVEGFFRHRDAYAALGFGWRRGVLLVGPPGTGKTMICKAIAAATPALPFLYVRDFRAGGGQEAIKTIFERARRLAPCVLAFEDIDGLVADDNRTVFLNELDGFQNNDGLLVVASSNHPERIDEALLKRPSRFDRVFHIGMPALAERRAFCRRLLARPALARRLAPIVDPDRLAEQVAARSADFTPAYLKEAFTSAALARAQDGALILDDAFAAAVLAQIAELRAGLRRLRNPDGLAAMRSTDSEPIGFRVGREEGE